MTSNRRLGVPMGAAGILLLWWAATSRQPQAPVEQTRLAPRVAPVVIAGRSGAAPEVHPDYLPPPEPVLRQSVQRRFSSPASNGAAAAGGPGAEAGNVSPMSAVTRLTGGVVNLPGGYGAPTASNGLATDGPPGNKRGAPGHIPPGRGDLPARSEDPDNGRPPGTPAPGAKLLSGAAANLVAAAHGLKAQDDAAKMRAESSVEASIMRQIVLDNKVDAGIRSAIAQLSSSGRPVTPAAVAKAAKGVLMDNGLTSDDVDMETAIARASGPPPPYVPPAAYAAAAKAIASVPPLDAATKAEVHELVEKQLVDKQPPPNKPATRVPTRDDPAPRGVLEAYKKNEGIFKKASETFGVKPEDILAILKIETDLGKNTGKYPLAPTLESISKNTEDKRHEKAAMQAVRDSAALTRLYAQGDLGDLKPDQIRGSYAGAMGIPQFLPTSWEAYSRAPDGGKRDPFNFATAAFSVGNYLKTHGYSKDVARSIWSYNHSQEYVDKVMGMSASIRPALDAAASRKAEPNSTNK